MVEKINWYNDPINGRYLFANELIELGVNRSEISDAFDIDRLRIPEEIAERLLRKRYWVKREDIAEVKKVWYSNLHARWWELHYRRKGESEWYDLFNNDPEWVYDLLVDTINKGVE
ncbi:hypothetical protein [Scytonema sp. NUACC26]|uniref:hypothetical protein n=1 Tax=Scytonema sp. NUACC26 TaxID=3140176 RepID=UPI0034DC55C8